MLERLRGKDRIAELCRKKGIAQSVANVRPADACFGRAPAIITWRERIKRRTIEHRRLQHRKPAA